MKKILMVLSLGLTSLTVTAQQEPLVSQYMFNHLLVNPAYAGSKDYAMASVLYRTQWVNLEGAPKTFVASLHGPLVNRKVGLGLSIDADKIGVTNRYDINGNYAYHIKLNEKFKIGLGIKGGITYYSAELSKLKIWDADDKVFPKTTQTSIIPVFGAGAYLYSDKFYAGLSVPELSTTDPNRPLTFNKKVDDVVNQVRHYYFATGGAIELSQDLALRPSALVKYTWNAPVEADLNLNVVIKQVLWIGGAYRTGDAFIGMIEVQPTKKLRIGYAYDFTTSELKNYSDGSHEIMIGYDFGYDIMKMKTPRYF